MQQVSLKLKLECSKLSVLAASLIEVLCHLLASNLLPYYVWKVNEYREVVTSMSTPPPFFILADVSSRNSVFLPDLSFSSWVWVVVVEVVSKLEVPLFFHCRVVYWEWCQKFSFKISSWDDLLINQTDWLKNIVLWQVMNSLNHPQ